MSAVHLLGGSFLGGGSFNDLSWGLLAGAGFVGTLLSAVAYRHESKKRRLLVDSILSRRSTGGSVRMASDLESNTKDQFLLQQARNLSQDEQARLIEALLNTHDRADEDQSNAA